MTGADAPIRALCLAGPTASGKTAVAMAFARAMAATAPVEIVSVDSALVYRGMDIGTAKPDRAERAEVPHHLIDVVDPTQSYSAAQFAADADRLIDEINGRGHLPLLVGGTMLYFKALRDGLHDLPPADPGIRAQIDAEAAERGWPALHAELARVDPQTAARLAVGDAQRVQRAIEVWRVSGRTLADWHAGAARPAADSGLPMVTLEPASRGWLHARIADRFDAMLAAGLLTEVESLRSRGDLHRALPAMRCVGYRQAWAALDSGDMAGLRDAGIAATRQLAKRQLTWLRATAGRRAVDCDARGAVDAAVAALRAAWRPASR